ncbi:TetR/AcrR family transcriptional regulator [Aureimonas leprariae]|nr:TetR/AcrR family transcriptional regulator [Aureimonas leprariae]
MTQIDRHDLAARSEEILERVTVVFARKGFDGASMQDLAAGAGMSVGNFYRYFPSKLALVEALVERCMRDVQRDLAKVRDEPDFFVAFRRLIEINRESLVPEEAAIWVHVDAGAIRHPEIRALREAMECGIRKEMFALLTREVEAGDPATVERLEEIADFLVVLVSGLFRRFAFGDREAERERFDRLTTLVIDTARDRLDAVRVRHPLLDAAE